MRDPILNTMLMSALACFAPTTMGACSPVRSHTAILSTAPFSQYRTFSFGTDESAPAGFKRTRRTLEVERRMLPLIANVLQEKGYAPAESGKKGDVVVAVASGSRRGMIRTESSSRGEADVMPDDEEDDFVEGAVVIDMFDGTNDGQVWHGAGRADVNPDKINDGLLERAIRDVLAPFPAHVAR